MAGDNGPARNDPTSVEDMPQAYEFSEGVANEATGGRTVFGDSTLPLASRTGDCVMADEEEDSSGREEKLCSMKCVRAVTCEVEASHLLTKRVDFQVSVGSANKAEYESALKRRAGGYLEAGLDQMAGANASRLASDAVEATACGHVARDQPTAHELKVKINATAATEDRTRR